MMSGEKQKKEPKFEEALARLEKIVSDLEKGNVELDKSLELFEEGIRMSRMCATRLAEAEKKIQKLSRSQGGKPEVSDFEEESENTQAEPGGESGTGLLPF